MSNPLYRIPIWVIGLLSLSGYLLLRLWFPLAPNYGQLPLPDIIHLAPTAGTAVYYALLLLALSGLAYLAYRQLYNGAVRLSLAQILFVTLLLALPLVDAFPVNATDLYRYFIRGRVQTIHNANPYLNPPSDFPADPFLPYAGEWADFISPYGPLWELLAGGVARVAVDDLYLALLLFKAVGLLLHLTATGLIWHLLHAKRPTLRAAYTAVWAWNPALLLTFVMDGHNDILMLVWLLLGALLCQRRWPALGLTVMVLGLLSKPIGLLALPVWGTVLLRQQPDWAARARLVLRAAVGSITAVFVAFLPFGSMIELAQRLFVEAIAGASFSVATLLILLARQVALPNAYDLISAWMLTVFVLLALWLLWQLWQGKMMGWRGTAVLFFAYIAQALNFRIWYAVWPFPWLLIDAARRNQDRNARRWLDAGLLFLLTSQLSVLIYGQVRIFLLRQDILWAHLIGVPFTLGLPLLLLWRKRPPLS